MARLDTSQLDNIGSLLPELRRDAVKRILEAGAKCYVQGWRDVIQQKHHVASGSMLMHVEPVNFREDLGSGSIEVYPTGNDSRGTRNATKAYILHYGRKAPLIKGDKFVDEAERLSMDKANAAMQEELNRIIQSQGG